MTKSSLTIEWKFSRFLFKPVLSTIIRNRRISIIIMMAVIIQTGLSLHHITFWSCPLARTAGIPCPGCGLTRAMEAMLRCDWGMMARFHVFAPLVGFTVLLISASAFLPGAARIELAERIEAVEKKTGIPGVFVTGLVAYWLFRIVFTREDFIALTIR
ncbi:MAG: DUF2752 domain-containing protein [bacterium]|nr:DUF2752 domain-containing protein [bacterium]